VKLPRGRTLFWLGYGVFGVSILILAISRVSEKGHAGPLLLTGAIILFLGIGLILFGLSLSVGEKADQRSIKYTCPRCGTSINHQSSPATCPNCDLLIDWSKAKTRQK
jgi:predicted RNA-binding Zn-ribbon protein involved in translation (DUF1610 family)